MRKFTKPCFSKTFLFATVFSCTSFAGIAQSTTYTPGAYSTVVPTGCTTMGVTVTGGAGGTVAGGGTGGKGGTVSATYTVTGGTTYYIYAGSKGVNGDGTAGGSSYGGGEDGGSGGNSGPASGAGGGAASDVRTTAGSLGTRIIIGGAGGGGMGNGCSGTAIGGNGGNPATAGASGGGGCGCSTAGGGAGTTGGGGARGGSTMCSDAAPGVLGAGGGTSSGTGGGGGGDYGGGAAYNGGGGGGSSFASTTSIVGSATFTNGTNTGDGSVIICFYPAVITSAAASTTICIGGTAVLTMTASSGVTYQWYSNTTASTTGGTALTTGPEIAAGSQTATYVGASSASAGTTYYYCIVTNTCGTATSALSTVIVSGGPISPITGPTSVCPGGNMTLSDISTPGVWSSTNTNAATVDPSSGIVYGVTVGATYISYTTGSCSNILPVTVSGVASITASATTVCAGSTIALSDATTGGVWSSDNTNVASISSASGSIASVNGISGGGANISYTIGSCAVGVAVNVTGSINPLTYTSTTVCAGTTINMSDATTGGVWSSSTTAATVAGGAVHGVAAGSTNISYTVGACAVGVAVTVVGSVSAITPALTAVCAGSSIRLSDATTGGVWSSDNTNVATVVGGVVTGASATGPVNISYTVGSCAVGIAITVSGAILPITPSISSVCVGSNIILTDGSPGGVWSSSTTAATVSGGTVHGVAAGTTNISYTSGACAVGVAITVGSLPALIAPVTSVCVGSAITLSDTTPGGVWSSDNSTAATVSGGVVTGGSSGTANISYTTGACAVGVVVTVSGPLSGITGGSATMCPGTSMILSDATPGGVWSSSNTNIATVLSGTVRGITGGSVTIFYTLGACSTSVGITVATLGPITGITTVCPGLTTTLSDTPIGGAWSSDNTSAATIDPSTGVVYGVGSGTTNISYTVGSCSVGIPVSAGALPAISGPTTVCPASTIILSDTTPGGVWSVSNTNIATVSGAGVVHGATAGTTSVVYSIGSCTVNLSVTVGPLPTIAGPTTVCPGSVITLSDASTGGVWSSSNTNRATIDPSLGVVTGVTAGTSNISYTIGTCSTGIAITVGALPALTGPTSVCGGSTITLSDATPGGVWTTSNSGVATVSGTGGVTGLSGGTVNISYTTGACSVGFSVTVNFIPAITGNTALCTGSTSALTDALTGGAWSSDNLPIATVSTIGVVHGVAPGTANISYTVGSCSVSVPVTVSTLTPITGPNGVCVGASITLSDVTPGGVWSSGGPTAATVSSSTGVVTGAASGSASIIYTLGACSVSLLINVGNTVGTITGPTTICIGSAITLSDGTPGGVWSSSNPPVATASGDVIHGLSVGTATISYSLAGCSSVYPVSVVAASAGFISGKDSVCPGAGHVITLSDNVAGGVWSSSSTSRATIDPVTGVVTGVAYGTTTIMYVVTTSCGTFTATFIVHVRTPAQCATGVDPTVDEQPASLKIFPNPNGGVFTMNLLSDADEEVHVVITNIVGEKVREFITTTNKATDVKLDPAAGIYLISATTSHGRYVAKVEVY